jgi:hypothetical protein
VVEASEKAGENTLMNLRQPLTSVFVLFFSLSKRATGGKRKEIFEGTKGMYNAQTRCLLPTDGESFASSLMLSMRSRSSVNTILYAIVLQFVTMRY